MNSRLLVQIDNIPESGYTLEFQVPWQIFSAFEALVADGEALQMDEVTGRLEILRVGDVFHVDGPVATALQAVCTRCLCEVRQPVRLQLNLHYTRRSAAPNDSLREELDHKKEAAGLYLFRDDSIDLQEAVYEQIVMSLPMRVLCRDTCKGLCSRCGADFNQTTCDCSRENPDNPFDVLRQLVLKKA